MKDDQPSAGAAAVVLTGGKSSRMGRPKALLPFDGEPLIVHAVRRLEPLFSEIIVVAAAEQELPPLRRGSGQALPVTLVRDQVAYQGPVAGIYYGLQEARGAIGFVTSCDVPFLSLGLISHLLSQITNYDVVVPYWEERLQPLFAVYRREVAPLLKDQLESGELRPISLYKKVRTREVGPEEIRRFDPEGLSFLNMNTPEDYQAALKRWREQRGPAEPAKESASVLCTVELLGVARLRAKTREVSLALPQGATVAHVFSALAEKLPTLVGPVIAPGGNSLASGHACNINGRDFVRDLTVEVRPGDRIFIISADAGG
ncbi:MAG: NTP transferase domain-containing protein [Deltaproteobacteria bacterium]|nr:NTP transferase domain-containing protein [Deltaproteobacteria bacterium]